MVPTELGAGCLGRSLGEQIPPEPSGAPAHLCVSGQVMGVHRGLPEFTARLPFSYADLLHGYTTSEAIGEGIQSYRLTLSWGN